MWWVRQAVRRIRQRDEGTSSLEFAVLTPAVFLVLSLGLVIGLGWMGQQRAETAARKGVEVARAHDSSPAEGTRRALDWLNQSDLVKDPAVSTTGSTADRVRITVTGEVATPFFGWSITINESAEGPVEQWEP